MGSFETENKNFPSTPLCLTAIILTVQQNHPYKKKKITQ